MVDRDEDIMKVAKLLQDAPVPKDTFEEELVKVLQANGLDHEPKIGVKHCTYCLMYNNLLAAHNRELDRAKREEI